MDVLEVDSAAAVAGTALASGVPADCVVTLAVDALSVLEVVAGLAAASVLLDSTAAAAAGVGCVASGCLTSDCVEAEGVDEVDAETVAVGAAGATL